MMTTKVQQERILAILAQAKGLAREYRALTGKPLGITGEVAEYEAARILDIDLTPVRHAGYDVTRSSDGRRYQIKGVACCLTASRASASAGSTRRRCSMPSSSCCSTSISTLSPFTRPTAGPSSPSWRRPARRRATSAALCP